MHDVTVVLQDQPGELGKLGRALGDAGINLAGACAITDGGESEIHLLVDDPEAAGVALEGSGLVVRETREVVVVDATDQPGELGSLAGRLGDAGVNIELMYVGTDTRLVFGVDDLDAARQALG